MTEQNDSQDVVTSQEATMTKTPETDHRAVLVELALSLKNASPSGVETIVDKMLEHLEAVKDPKPYEAKMAALRKAEDEREAQRAKDREALKADTKAA